MTATDCDMSDIVPRIEGLNEDELLAVYREVRRVRRIRADRKKWEEEWEENKSRTVISEKELEYMLYCLHAWGRWTAHDCLTALLDYQREMDRGNKWLAWYGAESVAREYRLVRGSALFVPSKDWITTKVRD